MFLRSRLFGCAKQKFKGKYIDEYGVDPALTNHAETCNIAAGYREDCTVLLENGRQKNIRCRLCTSCLTDFRRAYATAKCKLCPKLSFVWVLVAFLTMVCVFVVVLRLELSSSGRKKMSSHKEGCF